jgi:tRNA(Ile)-lysidine synthase
MFLQRLENAAREDCSLNREQPVLLGVSGGVDSLAMMLGLQALGYSLVIAHLDHALRPESRSEAEFIRSMAYSHGLSCTVQRVDVGQFAQEEGLSIEEAARQVRYRFLFQQAQRHRCQAVAVGHHADDQVETVLMHLLRGSALPGLTGMAYRRIIPQWDPEIPVVRPLLGLWRDEIEAYVESLGVKPCVDESNLDTRYHRNRIRHALIPELETYNPQIRPVIWRMADVLRAEGDYLVHKTQESYADCLIRLSEGNIELSRTTFLNYPLAIRRRVLRQAIEGLRPDLRDIGYEAIARGLAFVEQHAAGGEIDLVARLNLAVIGDALIIKTWEASLPDFGHPLLPDARFETPLAEGSTLSLTNGWQLEVCLLDEIPDNLLSTVKNLPPKAAWLDADCLLQPLRVRAPKEGDRIQPLGMGGHTQSLQDLFVNLKVPAHVRSEWPLVVSGGEMVWVVGLRPAEPFKITAKTRRILTLRLVRNRT